MIMRRFALVVAAILIFMLFIGCETASVKASVYKASDTTEALEKQELVAFDGETNRGTQIVDREESAFDVADVDMMSTPGSTCFSKIGYDSDYKILVLTFRETGVTYLYMDFPSSQWRAFKNADSLGRYYQYNIKGQYESAKWG